MRKAILLLSVMLSADEAAWGQVPVSAGGQLQQIPPAPVITKSSPDIVFDKPAAAPDNGPRGPRILVHSLRLTGQTLFAEADLLSATGFQPDTQLDLGDLRMLASKITGYYNRRGYFLAQAYVPAQDIAQGIVTIAIVEGRYGQVGLDNKTNLSPRTANDILAGLEPGTPVATPLLEQRLLLLSDIPGVRVQSTLSPGSAPGTSDLLVALTPGRRISGSIEGDNAGNRYTGVWRAGGTINLNNAAGIGDVLSLRVLTSFDGLAYGRASYQALVGRATVGVAFAHLAYRLGREFESLDASGNAEIVSVYASYPLLRSRESNLNLVVGGDAKWFEDKFGLVSSISRRRVQVGSIGLSGDAHDGPGGGWTAYSAAVSFGSLDIRDPASRAIDAATARSDGGYGKLQFSLARLQPLAGPLSIFGQVRGQVAFDNLDISEKMELGGAYGVRAYPEGEAYGDQGYIATAEARLTLSTLEAAIPGDMQLFAFVDAGQVDFARRRWFAGPNSATRSAYGGGLAWAIPGNIFAKATYARKLGDEVATSAPDKSGRFWVQLSKIF